MTIIIVQSHKWGSFSHLQEEETKIGYALKEP
jgi:hypothetical protein